ncbi:MAG TPA: carbon-nitrogen hydrolase family protein [Caulobacteraceae bacterium]|jgi:predicted amidohydrolase|nr:carbon-nitrogen hydrolase family protein [Caulobacteraceae bacterium]
MKVALVQLRTPADPQAALAHVTPFVREAAASGARLIATPEGTNVLQRDRAILLPMLRPMEQDVCVAGLAALAGELRVWLLVGSALVRRDDGKAANRSILLRPDGAIAATYDKIHMFDVDLPTGERSRESGVYEPGEQLATAQVEDAKLGLTICYDMRFPLVYQRLARAGAEVMTIPSAFTRPTGQAHWEVLLRARAIETGSFVLAPAQGGTHADGRATWGRSMVIGPWGEVLAAVDHDEPGVICADIDPVAVSRARTAIPALANAREFAGP